MTDMRLSRYACNFLERIHCNFLIFELLIKPEPEPYSFNWQYGDETGNGQFRREEQDKNGVVRGSYGYTDAWGLYRIVDFIADKDGYRGMSFLYTYNKLLTKIIFVF